MPWVGPYPEAVSPSGEKEPINQSFVTWHATIVERGTLAAVSQALAKSETVGLHDGNGFIRVSIT
jgi:hypothetical protein